MIDRYWKIDLWTKQCQLALDFTWIAVLYYLLNTNIEAMQEKSEENSEKVMNTVPVPAFQNWLLNVLIWDAICSR